MCPLVPLVVSFNVQNRQVKCQVQSNKCLKYLNVSVQWNLDWCYLQLKYIKVLCCYTSVMDVNNCKLMFIKSVSDI